MDLRRVMRGCLAAGALISWVSAGAAAAQGVGAPEMVSVFADDVIHFTPDEPKRYDTDRVKAADNGRAILRRLRLPAHDTPVRIIAHLVLKPVAQDELSVVDHWDRAGSVRLEQLDGPPLEIVKFMTSYGGRTEHKVDVTELAGALRGDCLISAFVDTWVSPAWKIDFSLEYRAETDETNATWLYGLMLEDGFDAETPGRDGLEVDVDIPGGLKRVVLQYYVSGHCTDGRGGDEFVPKDNVIRVDGIVVYRFRPWRDDCDQLRAINPYCKKWSDGSWSSDFSRSGWCPGDVVRPLELDLTDHLTPGRHRVRFTIENIRPKDSEGNSGYWRVSSRLIGYDRLPQLQLD